MKSSFLHHQKLFVSFMVIILCSVIAFSQSSDTEIKRSVIAGGGNTMTTGTLKLTGTTGQSAAGKLTMSGDGTRRAVAGFWQPESHIDAGNRPTDLLISNSRVDDGKPAGWTLGVFSTIDPNPGDSFTYSLVTGEGSSDNDTVIIEADALKTKAPVNLFAQPFYNIRVRTTDQMGLSFEKKFILVVDPVGEIHFSTPTFQFNENVGSAAIVIVRSGFSRGDATVSFTTVLGLGTAGPADYTPVTQTVQFLHGEEMKTVNVPINNDSLVENTETFIIRLSNVQGAAKPSSNLMEAEVLIRDDDPTAAVINFSQSNYTVTETGPGFIDITVTRGGDPSAPLTVDYATPYDSDSPMETSCVTRNGTAMPRCDFTVALGTLRFAAGETSRTFTILISQDSYLEGPETLPITLSNVTGGELGSQATATLTITDDLTEPSTNAIDDPANFVRQHYHDFLNREPDAAGLDFWTRQITECGQDDPCIIRKRVNVSAAFFLSIEFQQTGYFVERMYKVAYGDAIGQSSRFPTHDLPVPMIKPDEFLRDSQEIRRGVVVGQSGWETTIENNRKEFATMFTQRPRFLAELPTIMTAGQFVDKLNSNAGNPLSEQERNQLVDALISGVKTRAQVLRAIAEHPKLYQAEFNRAFVLMQYYGYLRRNPNRTPDSDWAGYEFWLNKLNEFGGDFVNAEMVRAFLDSAEYRQRFRQ